MFHKIMKSMYWLLPVLLLSLCAFATAQESSTQEKKEEKAEQKAEKKGHHSTKTVTGCLQKGDEPGEFAITDEDGKTWGLHAGDDVKLADHVGHKVSVTGSATRESKEEKSAEKKEAKEGKVEPAAGKAEIGDLRVTKVTMVSTSCTK
ncbi:MAG TPA: hypothetical protein VFJ47_17015 [Terriglobales bacterium]|nr:hypothetical protein [Terriglobales bacterium]